MILAYSGAPSNALFNREWTVHHSLGLTASWLLNLPFSLYSPANPSPALCVPFSTSARPVTSYFDQQDSEDRFLASGSMSTLSPLSCPLLRTNSPLLILAFLPFFTYGMAQSASWTAAQSASTNAIQWLNPTPGASLIPGQSLLASW